MPANYHLNDDGDNSNCSFLKLSGILFFSNTLNKIDKLDMIKWYKHNICMMI